MISEEKKITGEEYMSWIFGYLLWVCLAVFFMLIAASIGEFVSKDAGTTDDTDSSTIGNGNGKRRGGDSNGHAALDQGKFCF